MAKQTRLERRAKLENFGYEVEKFTEAERIPAADGEIGTVTNKTSGQRIYFVLKAPTTPVVCRECGARVYGGEQIASELCTNHLRKARKKARKEG